MTEIEQTDTERTETDQPTPEEWGGLDEPGEPDADAAAEPAEEDEDDAPRPVFRNVEEFVTERIIPIYVRPEGGQFRWCAEWWRHEEAFLRFHALWHAWEMARLEPAGLANWYRDHFDFQFSIIMSDTGPFRECTSRRHQEPRPLPYTPAPEGWFEDES